MKERPDDYTRRRAHLADLTEEQLEAHFWDLADKLTQPLIELAHGHTSPSIERSVLLRMGLSSIESQSLVSRAVDTGLIGKGAGHIVYKISKHTGLDIRAAGQALAEGRYWDDAARLFAQSGPSSNASGTETSAGGQQ